MADLQQTMGAAIRRLRRERELTLKELAERSILSVVYLGEIERGKKYPSALVLERLAAALDLNVPDLLEQVADELRGVEQPTMAIGFTMPVQQSARPALSRTTSTGTVLNMLVA
ncbi:MAG TPA: helix-turn-helix transcriptional regulator [Ktedonobacterales bacterium]|nr:helix-turn-helix transcriptional regulator [Ktedonobacterales bacterium]